jgi:hypothetical protein
MISDTSILVSAESRIYGSADGGATWTEEWAGGKGDDVLGLSVLPSKVAFAVGKGGLLLRRAP